jgi:protein HIRA/HIR1
VRETFSLRLSWNTDGSNILAVNSLQPPSHCACVVNRERWDADYSVVGHLGAVTVVRFNPLLFEDPESDDPCSCFALGAQVC